MHVLASAKLPNDPVARVKVAREKKQAARVKTVKKHHNLLLVTLVRSPPQTHSTAWRDAVPCQAMVFCCRAEGRDGMTLTWLLRVTCRLFAQVLANSAAAQTLPIFFDRIVPTSVTEGA